MILDPVGGGAGGGGAITSVSNSDGTLTISPTTGLVVASLALGHANTWTGQQTFNTAAPIFGTATASRVLAVDSGKALISSFASSVLLNSLTDATGTGVAVFATTPTFTTSIICPLIIGGTGTTSDLFLQTTSGVGAAGADMHFLVGNNGATEAMTILNSGNVGMGQTSPWATITCKGAPSAPSLVHHAQSILGLENNAGSQSEVAFTIDNASPYAFSIQHRDTVIDTASYPIALNPLGGNVGIGTASPSVALHSKTTSGTRETRTETTDGTSFCRTSNVSDAGQTSFNQYGTAFGGTVSGISKNGLGLVFTTGSAGLMVSSSQGGAAPMYFDVTGTAPAMTILSGGNVGVNVSPSTAAFLHVYSSGSSTSIPTPLVVEYNTADNGNSTWGAALMHLKTSSGSTGPWMDLWYAPGTRRWAFGLSSSGNWIWRTTGDGTDPVQAANIISIDTTGAFVTGSWKGTAVGAQWGGTGVNSSASTGVPRVSSGSWTFNAGISHLASSTSADLAGVLSDETGSGVAVFGTAPTFTTSINLGSANIITDTSTGTRIGTATNQKLSFFNSSPVVQQTGDIGDGLSALGLVVSPSLKVANGGTGAGTLTGILKGNGTSAITAISIPSDATQFLNGAASPAYAQVRDSDLSTSDITTNNVSTSKHGFAPKLDNVATHFLNGQGGYTAPVSSGISIGLALAMDRGLVLP